MALSPHSDYTTDIASPFTDNWLFQFFYGATSSTNYTGVSFKDITVTDQNDNSKAFNGCITNIPSIRESVNPLGGMVKTSNITVDIADTSIFSNFFGGSNYYINKSVIVWSVSNDTTDLDNALRIYTGRLKTVSHSDSKMTFSIQSHRPWDDITIPNTKTSVTNNYFPVVYGSFTPETSTVSSKEFVNASNLFPAPVDSVKNNKYYCLLPSFNASEGRLHYYEKNVKYTELASGYGTGDEAFVPLDEANNNYESYQGGQAITTPIDLDRGFKASPNEATSLGGVESLSNMMDSDPATNIEFSETEFADAGLTINNPSTGDDNQTITLTFSVPQIDHEIQSFKTVLAYEVDWVTSNYDSMVYLVLNEVSYGETDNILTISEQHTYSGSLTTATIDKTSDMNGQMPDSVSITMNARFTTQSGGGTLDTLSIKFYQIYYTVQTKVPALESDKSNTANNSIGDIKYLYSGEDGIARSWDTGNSAEYGFNIHRDLLWRYAGIDATEYSAPTMNGSAWDDSAPSGFDDASEGKARVVVLEPTSLGKILDRLAYESCLMFRFGATENPQYISIKETESTDHTLTDDKITGLKISHTPVSELKSKYVINSDPHPAEDKYLTQATFTNSNRANWIAIDEENIFTENLKYRYNNITEFHTYLDRLIGEVKLRVSCKIVDPAIGVIVEVGDIVAFTNGSMTTKPFGTTWTSKQFVVVETNKSIGGQCAVKLWEI